jgi:hypothetical protein
MRLQASTCFLVLLRARVTLLPQGGPLSSRLVPAGLDYIDGLQIGPPNVRFGFKVRTTHPEWMSSDLPQTTDMR